MLLGLVVRILQKYDGLEYRGDWHAQRHEAEIVGKPSQGVNVALYEERPKVVGNPEPLGL